MRVAAAVAATGLALVTAAAAPADEPAPTRDCRTRMEPTRGHFRFAERGDLVLGPISFFGVDRSDRPRAGRRPDGRFFVKVPVKVLWGPPVTVTVAAPNRGEVALEYTRPLDAKPTSVRFVGCPPGTPMWNGLRHRRVTGFSGGFTFARHGCYRVEVRVEGRVAVHRGRVPLGAPCR